MNEDHLDPDRYLYGIDDGAAEDAAVMDILKEYSSNRWDYDKIHCCITGKDADLEPWGQQGIELSYVKDTREGLVGHFVLHCGKTFAGTDVCLNIPEDDTYEEKREQYLEIAQEIIGTCGYCGEWSGDDWYITQELDFTANVVLNDDDEVDTQATWLSIKAAFDEAVKPWDTEITAVDESLNCESGWARRLPDGSTEHVPSVE